MSEEDFAIEKRKRIASLLIRAYFGEIETAINYLAAAANLNGLRAQVVRDMLKKESTTEFGHAALIAARMRVLDIPVPGSAFFRQETHMTSGQSKLQTNKTPLSVFEVIRGVLMAEGEAIEVYQKLIAETENFDHATNHLAIELLADEQEHDREFTSFLRELSQPLN